VQGHLVARDVASKRRIDEDWGSLTWLASRSMGNSPGLTFGRVVIRRGKANPRHSHPNCDEVLYLLAGRLEHSLGSDKVMMEAGDTLVVPAGCAHNALSVGDVDADMIVAYSSGERQFRPEK
jgi:mannose-6-phosphate isomerase-like protein (cupin superfamily)